MGLLWDDGELLALAGGVDFGGEPKFGERAGRHEEIAISNNVLYTGLMC